MPQRLAPAVSAQSPDEKSKDGNVASADAGVTGIGVAATARALQTEKGSESESSEYTDATSSSSESKDIGSSSSTSGSSGFSDSDSSETSDSDGDASSSAKSKNEPKTAAKLASIWTESSEQTATGKSNDSSKVVYKSETAAAGRNLRGESKPLRSEGAIQRRSVGNLCPGAVLNFYECYRMPYFQEANEMKLSRSYLHRGIKSMTLLTTEEETTVSFEKSLLVVYAKAGLPPIMEVLSDESSQSLSLGSVLFSEEIISSALKSGSVSENVIAAAMQHGSSRLLNFDYSLWTVSEELSGEITMSPLARVAETKRSRLISNIAVQCWTAHSKRKSSKVSMPSQNTMVPHRRFHCAPMSSLTAIVHRSTNEVLCLARRRENTHFPFRRLQLIKDTPNRNKHDTPLT
jgi:hypothetical protein